MCHSQAEVLLGEFWDPSSGAIFAEEGDQQRFWKLTRRFVEGLAAGGAAERVKVVSSPRLTPIMLWLCVDKTQGRGGTADAARTKAVTPTLTRQPHAMLVDPAWLRATHVVSFQVLEEQK